MKSGGSLSLCGADVMLDKDVSEICIWRLFLCKHTAAGC